MGTLLCVVSYRNSTSNHNCGLCNRSGCHVVSYRNSTSNHNIIAIHSGAYFVVSYRNSTSNHNCVLSVNSRIAVVSYRNSTSNHNISCGKVAGDLVVSYRNSTSNHNNVLYNEIRSAVVSYRNSTSNHNSENSMPVDTALYLIEILHQTTTVSAEWCDFVELYLIEILHQTTTCILCVSTLLSCILSKFYIKPQQRRRFDVWCYRCILSKFYIKPQLLMKQIHFVIVVSYRNSTSNHNFSSGRF